jgi:hypothetical protein
VAARRRRTRARNRRNRETRHSEGFEFDGSSSARSWAGSDFDCFGMRRGCAETGSTQRDTTCVQKEGPRRARPKFREEKPEGLTDPKRTNPVAACNTVLRQHP